MSPIEISTFNAGMLKKSRWNLILRGIILLLIGAVMFANPESFFRTLTMIIGVILLIDGVFMLGFTLSWGRIGSINFILAVIILLIGLFALLHPQGTNLIIACAVGLWIFLSAVQDIYLGIMVREARSLWWFITAFFMLILGGVIFVAPWTGIEIAGVWLGLLLLFSGAFTIAAAISIWNFKVIE